MVITGTLPDLSRDEAKELVEKAGGKVSSSVSKKTSFVLLGAEPGSKYEKAVALGTPILNQEEFLALLNSRRKGMPKNCLIVASWMYGNPTGHLVRLVFYPKACTYINGFIFFYQLLLILRKRQLNRFLI